MDSALELRTILHLVGIAIVCQNPPTPANWRRRVARSIS